MPGGLFQGGAFFFNFKSFDALDPVVCIESDAKNPALRFHDARLVNATGLDSVAHGTSGHGWILVSRGWLRARRSHLSPTIGQDALGLEFKQGGAEILDDLSLRRGSGLNELDGLLGDLVSARAGCAAAGREKEPGPKQDGQKMCGSAHTGDIERSTQLNSVRHILDAFSPGPSGTHSVRKRALAQGQPQWALGAEALIVTSFGSRWIYE